MKYLKLKPKEPLERDITRNIRGYLNIRGIFHYKQWQGLGSLPGVSDIIGIYRGKYLAIEVKCPGNKLSDRQKAFLDRVNEEGGIGFMATSVDDVIEKLR